MKLAIIIFMISFCGLFAESVYSIRVNQSTYSVKALKHYENDLISVNQISRYIIPNSKIIKDKNVIQANDFTISFTPGAIYIVKENWLGKRVAQLDLPILEMKQNTYFPLKSFLFSLDTLNIYNVLAGDDNKHFLLTNNDFSGLSKLPKVRQIEELVDESKNYITPRNNIYINQQDGMNIKVSESEPFKKSFEETQKKVSRSLNLLKPEEFKPTEIISKPSDASPIEESKREYLLPEKLIRKELEEIKNNPQK